MFYVIQVSGLLLSLNDDSFLVDESNKTVPNPICMPPAFQIFG
jgi:hypothetical protein